MKQDITVTSQSPSPIEHVRQEFELWRKTRHNLCPIPNTLWDSAIQLSGKYTICQISKTLRLNHSDLKQRILKASEKKTDSAPAFIRMDFPRQSVLSEWSIEMENPDGAKMKISAKSAELPDLPQFCQNFIRGCR